MEVTDESPVKEDLVPGSDRLFLSFGGIRGAMGMPPFEFYRSARILDCSKIFLRDLFQSWYQRGLPSIGDDAFAIGDYLRRKIAESGATQIRFVGNSMGGYAALLFCSMLQCGKAIAFAPQTFVSPDKRLKYRDRRWPLQIAEMHKSRTASHIYDLQSWIRDHYPAMQASVYVSKSDKLDMVHANELAGFANVEIHRFAGAGHGLVARLRDEGSLAQILNA
jgi:pimeloyl-ACP methyl ester carboxylesterase